MQKSIEELKYTSTEYKFFRHLDQLKSYHDGTGKTIISTHISPEGSCNLKCSYCSVWKRDKNDRIEFETIVEYITKLKSRGLKACIITGGGEPTLYPEFNKLVRWLELVMRLKVALITNGTCKEPVGDMPWNLFTWVRISLNDLNRVHIPKIAGTLGCSIIYTGQDISYFRNVEKLIKNTSVQYVRVVPDCTLNKYDLELSHLKIGRILRILGNKKFFHQNKYHRKPKATVCHQAYFRPYLSEVEGGTVYPCDSLVLNNSVGWFSTDYAICKAEDILDFMDGKIKMKFDPPDKCSGCVFTDNVDSLDMLQKPMLHEEFV